MLCSLTHFVDLANATPEPVMLKTIDYFGRSLLIANSALLFAASSVLGQTLPPPPTEEDVYQFNAPDHSPSRPNRSNPEQNTLFRVQVYGNSEQLLSLVRRVEPEAFVPKGKDIIQAGLFSERVNARELVESLSEQGIRADIIEVSQPRSLSSSREFISLSTPAAPQNSPSESSEEFIPLAVETTPTETNIPQETTATKRGYYVVIPSRERNLSQTAQAVQAAGVQQEMIQKRDAPLGTHVAIGPFDQRAQASRWSSQLQSEGLNARVYFGE